jgi:phosphoserine phosphatase
MSTLAEIESAIEQLPASDVVALRKWLDAREVARSPLAKWQGKGTGVVMQSGGVDAFLRRARGDDDDRR